MKLKFVAAAALAAVTATSAFANNVTPTINVPGNTVVFGAVHTDSTPFQDIFTFTFAGTVTANASLVTVFLNPGTNINFTSATLNGNAIALPGAGWFEFAQSGTIGPTVSPIVLVVNGVTDASGSINSSYSGTFNITPVPEPETYALMLAGLGAVGFIARRRRTV